jgi:hypothetical protein
MKARLDLCLFGALVAILTAGLVAALPSDASAGTNPTRDAATAPLYRLCESWDQTSCTKPGTLFLCYNRYPDEPGLCRCRPTLVWVCG